MTDWELGNDIMCGVVDKMMELSKEAEAKQPGVARLLRDIARDFGPLVNRLMNDKDDPIGMCPVHPDEEYMYFDGTEKDYYKKGAHNG